MSKTRSSGSRGPARTGLCMLTALLAGSVFAAASPALAQALSTTQGASADSSLDGTSDTTSGTDTPDPTTTQALPTLTPMATDGMDESRMNLPQGRVEQDLPDGASAGRAQPLSGETDGIRLGSFVLRPSITQRLGHEMIEDGAGKRNRTFSETGLKGTLTSDWSRHQLDIEGEGVWQETISGQGQDRPRADIRANLRLDLSEGTTATIRGDYGFDREENTDPNAISGASVQSGVHQFNGGLSLQRELGLLRGTVSADVTRSVYSDAEFPNGTNLSLADRDRTSAVLTTRLGYQVSPVLIPFIEASIGRIAYDEERDRAGFARSADTYAARTGVALDLGEKLRGELALGYTMQRYDDSRLADIEAYTVDGNVTWSPRLGTNVNLALRTSIEPSTTPGVSGSVLNEVNLGLSQQLRETLVARLSGSTRWTRFDGNASTNDRQTMAVGAGLTWGINRYLDLTADVNYEQTDFESGGRSRTTTALIGITAKR
ncbi:outer membrane beta-barrel protein [Peteryoungia desertarenae]|uniref:Outer membrane beta-barrel protein n=1 Tax=Peteryoungia desertarenae TaxID=1813451 RepID=A0ABX6QHR5_9HYPH|nr:outer membrane beta-barrel protein [Peteryoungia desertarenae]QLF68114.1 outer membrane beta-barrel protein [Peteryoungia desertarenae]